MEEKDVEAAAKLERENFSYPWKMEDFREMLHRSYASFYVAEADGEIIGCIGLRNIAGEGEISNVVVAEHRRRQGIATELFRRVFEDAQSLDIDALTLEVRAGNGAAVGLYERLGFAVEGRRRDFYEKPREDALIMWKR